MERAFGCVSLGLLGLVLLGAIAGPPIALGLPVQSGSAIEAPSPPQWPSSFETVFTLTLPYVESVQVVGLKIPIHIWFDGARNFMRTDVYGGLDSTYLLPNVTYNIFPRISKKACWKIDTTAGPTELLSSEGGGDQPLPDISSWKYSGRTKMPGGTPAFIWTLSENHGEKTNSYTFYTAQEDGRPLKLYMVGVNLLSGSHFDEYIADFVLFNKLYPGSAAVFKPPSLCDQPISMQQQQQGLGQDMGDMLVSQVLSLTPTVLTSGFRTGAAGAAVRAVLDRMSMKQQQQQQHVGLDLDLSAASLLEASSAVPAHSHLSFNHLLVDTWNKEHAAAHGYTLALNHFASLSHSHFMKTKLGHTSLSLQKQQELRQRPDSAFLGVYERQRSAAELPAQVDYRGSGADLLPKDQAFCGSCWSFGTTGTMGGTWFIATGEPLSLSEQQLVDCSWDYESNGCWGGEGESAMQLVKDAGGAAMEDDYPYLGQNGYCKTNLTSKAAFFSGYKTIAVGDELALMEALATNGPLYVALDAGHPTFKFYSQGVYHREDCATDRDHLNHAVTLVGYGTTEDGVDYWMIRNSWSKLWGSDGYMKITRKGNDCGITTGAVQAVPDESAVARARARKVAKA